MLAGLLYYCSAGAVPAGGLPLTVLYQLTAEIERLKAELAQRDAALSSWQQLLKPDGTVCRHIPHVLAGAVSMLAPCCRMLDELRFFESLAHRLVHLVIVTQTYSFLEACKDGRCQLIEFFLQHNADVKQTDKGCTGWRCYSLRCPHRRVFTNCILRPFPLYRPDVGCTRQPNPGMRSVATTRCRSRWSRPPTGPCLRHRSASVRCVIMTFDHWNCNHHLLYLVLRRDGADVRILCRCDRHDDAAHLARRQRESRIRHAHDRSHRSSFMRPRCGTVTFLMSDVAGAVR